MWYLLVFATTGCDRNRSTEGAGCEAMNVNINIDSDGYGDIDYANRDDDLLVERKEGGWVKLAVRQNTSTSTGFDRSSAASTRAGRIWLEGGASGNIVGAIASAVDCVSLYISIDAQSYLLSRKPSECIASTLNGAFFDCLGFAGIGEDQLASSCAVMWERSTSNVLPTSNMSRKRSSGVGEWSCRKGNGCQC
jgi:hypothetical protein